MFQLRNVLSYSRAFQQTNALNWRSLLLYDDVRPLVRAVFDPVFVAIKLKRRNILTRLLLLNVVVESLQNAGDE